MSKFGNLNKREYYNLKHPSPLPIIIPLSYISNKYYKPIEILNSIYDTLCHFIINININGHDFIDVIFDSKLDSSFKITNYNDMIFIWNNGFYGKGNLSRSEPTFEKRMLQKINDYLNKNTKQDTDTDTDTTFSEEITKNRRYLREIWKNERISLIKLEKDIKINSINGEISNLDKEKLEIEREKLSKLKDDLIKGNVRIDSNTPINSDSIKNRNILRIEDYDIIIDSNNIKNIEYLQLDNCETIYLKQLNMIRINFDNIPNISLTNLLKNLIEIYDFELLLNYVVYYHYKTLGWCVKNGLKFSCDYILYQRGPPFSHAEFSIKIVTNEETDSLIDYSAISRVVSGVKKNLILCFVNHPNFNSSQWLNIWNNYLIDGDLISLLNNFSINEINWKRWTPSRTRM